MTAAIIAAEIKVKPAIFFRLSDVSLLMGSTFSPTVRQHENIKDKFNEIKGSVVNEVIDYELYPFHEELRLPDMPMSEEARIHFQEVKEIQIHVT